MGREEYMKQLAEALAEVDKETAADILDDYAAHFERAIEEGHTEEEIIAELGSIDEFVEELRQFTTFSKQPVKENVKNTVQPKLNNSIQPENVTQQEQDSTLSELNKSSQKENSTLSESNISSQEQDSTLSESNKSPQGQDTPSEPNKAVQPEQDSPPRADGSTQDWSEVSREEQHKDAQGNAEYQYSDNTGRRNKDYSSLEETIGKAVNGTFRTLENGAGQLGRYLDKASEKFGELFSNFEKTNEKERDYHNRQEHSRYNRQETQDTAQGYFGYTSKNWNNQKRENQYSDEAEKAKERAEKLSEYYGSLMISEGIRRVVVDAKLGDIKVLISPDADFHYIYQNEGSEGSKAVYRLQKHISQDTLFLEIIKDEQAIQQKNHFGILGNFFAGDADFTLELQVPAWIKSIKASSISGEITADNVCINTFQAKTTSGDISLEKVNIKKCMAESISGEVRTTEGKYEYVLFSSKSGNVKIRQAEADKAAFKSVSGEVSAVWLNVAEAALSSTTGDSSAKKSHANNISIESKSGDARTEELAANNLKISSISGDIAINKAAVQNILSSSVSGDLDIQNVKAKIIKASATSGDMSLRGTVDEYILNGISGDIIVVQKGDTKAHIDSKSGDVHFHLQNNNAGFISNAKTRGDITYRYHTLQLSEAKSGEYRYGMEGSRLEIKLISGDITITD